MSKHNIIIQITVIFIWEPSNCKSEKDIHFFSAYQFTLLLNILGIFLFSNKLDMTLKFHNTYLLTFEEESFRTSRTHVYKAPQ